METTTRGDTTGTTDGTDATLGLLAAALRAHTPHATINHHRVRGRAGCVTVNDGDTTLLLTGEPEEHTIVADGTRMGRHILHDWACAGIGMARLAAWACDCWDGTRAGGVAAMRLTPRR